MSSNDRQPTSIVRSFRSFSAEVAKLGATLLELTGSELKITKELPRADLPDSAPIPRIPQTGRSQDEIKESTADRDRRELLGTYLVISFFLIALLAGMVFLVTYWKGENNTTILGGSLSVFLGAMGITLVIWARALIKNKQAIEPRHTLQSKPSEWEDTVETFCAGARDIRRRRMLQWMGMAGMGMLGTMALSLIRSLGSSPYAELYARIWKAGQRLVTSDGKPITVASLQPGSTVTVFPEDQIGSERAQTVLIRVQQELLQLPIDRTTWAPSGYLAYSRVCTHAGCPVGEYEAEQCLLLCPCHQSTFDVLRSATPTGGPAARALPQLPLYVDKDGTLRAGGGFTSPPGPGFWGIS